MSVEFVDYADNIAGRIIEEIGYVDDLAQLFEELAAYHERERQRWREADVFAGQDFDWLERQIERGVEYERKHRIGAMAVRLELILNAVRKDAYTPILAVQSFVSESIGDTRLVTR